MVPNLGLLLGAILLVLFGSQIRQWKWTLTGSVVITVLFGALLGLGRPDRKGMMIAFVFINQITMGWGQYLSIAFTQLGVRTLSFLMFTLQSRLRLSDVWQVDQEDLGVSGGLSGVARNGGGVVALTVSLTILANVQANSVKELVPAAVIAAGLPSSSVEALMTALPLGAAALLKVPGMTEKVLGAAFAAFQQSYVVALRYVIPFALTATPVDGGLVLVGLRVQMYLLTVDFSTFRTTALASMSFGGISILACLWCKDIDNRMTNKIEIFLENDENADKNKFH